MSYSPQGDEFVPYVINLLQLTVRPIPPSGWACTSHKFLLVSKGHTLHEAISDIYRQYLKRIPAPKSSNSFKSFDEIIKEYNDKFN